MTKQPKEPKTEEPGSICPYWHQVSADFASMYPGGGYCEAGCHQRIKVMAAKTFDEICNLRYPGCEGFQRLQAEGETAPRRVPGKTER